LLSQDLDQAVTNVFVGLLRYQSGNDVLTFPNDAIQFTVVTVFDHAVLRLRCRRRHLGQAQGHAVGNRAVAACAGQQYGIVGRGFIEIATQWTTEFRHDIFGPTIAGDPLALFEFVDLVSDLPLQFLD